LLSRSHTARTEPDHQDGEAADQQPVADFYHEGEVLRVIYLDRATDQPLSLMKKPGAQPTICERIIRSDLPNPLHS